MSREPANLTGQGSDTQTVLGGYFRNRTSVCSPVLFLAVYLVLSSPGCVSSGETPQQQAVVREVAAQMRLVVKDLEVLLVAFQKDPKALKIIATAHKVMTSLSMQADSLAAGEGTEANLQLAISLAQRTLSDLMAEDVVKKDTGERIRIVLLVAQLVLNHAGAVGKSV